MKSLAKTINSDKNMTDNKMTPEQLVKEWLPEYKKRLRNWQENAEAAGSAFSVDYNWFCKTHFAEALEAFARHVWDQACREQREMCAEEAIANHLWVDFHDFSLGCDGCEVDKDSILDAPAPEFKLTEKE